MTKLQIAYQQARLFRRNILTGMHPDTAKFEFICTMEAHDIPRYVWQHALAASVDLDALDAFLQATKRSHAVNARDIKPGMQFCLYPPRKAPICVTVLEVYFGWHITPGWIKPTPETFSTHYVLKPYTQQPSKYAKCRVIDGDGKIYWCGLSSSGLPLIASYPQRASATGWLGWVSNEYIDPYIEDENPYEALELTLP